MVLGGCRSFLLLVTTIIIYNQSMATIIVSDAF